MINYGVSYAKLAHASRILQHVYRLEARAITERKKWENTLQTYQDSFMKALWEPTEEEKVLIQAEHKNAPTTFLNEETDEEY